MAEMSGDTPLWPIAAIFPGRGLAAAETSLAPVARRFDCDDGARLAVLDWRPEGDAPARGNVIVLHGVQSHAGWYHGLGRRLAAAGYRAVFPDRRGSGANTEARGHAASARRLIDDIGGLARQLRAEAPGLPVGLAGISWGGKLVLAAAARHPEAFQAIALVCPGLTPQVGVSRGERLAIATALLTGRGRTKTFPIPLADPALFTADAAAQAFIAQDPLSLRVGTAGLLATSFFLDRRVQRAVGRIHQPALLMLAGHDRIVDNSRTQALFDRLPAPRKELIAYPDAHHTLEFEPDPGVYARDLIGWLDQNLKAI